MTWTRVTLIVAIGWLATRLLDAKRRPGAFANTTEAGARHDRPTAWADESASGAPAGANADSPNDAERLQARGVASPAGDDGPASDPLKSTSQDGPYARAPGLPDFARGA